MAKLQCTECGQIFDSKLEACPNCGCPASDCHVINDEQQSNTSPNMEAETRQQATNSHAEGNEGMGYVDIDSDNVFLGIYHWLSPKNISLPYNSKPTKVTVDVDNDAEDVFEIEKSLFYILEAFALKLSFVYVLFFLLVMVIYGAVTYSVINTIEDKTGMSIILGVFSFIGVIVCIIIGFMIFLYIFRPYWSHIHVRLRELHIRHWRNVYRAIKKDAQ